MQNNYTKIKPKKSIKKEYYEMKPCLVRAHNLRFIEPYEFKYQLYTKGRWVGRRLIDVLVFEFKQYDRDYFIQAIKEEKLKINNKQVEPDHILKRDDFITHCVIRKENPIIDQQLDIVYESENFLVVDKPSSWPVHVCGGYQFNTLHRILMDEFGYSELKVLHRLDKHTSGIVIMAKNKISAENFRKKMHTDKVQKTYFCRVKGDFCHDKIKVIRSIIYVDKAKGVYTDVDDNEKCGSYFEANNNTLIECKSDMSQLIIQENCINSSLEEKNKKGVYYYATDTDKKGARYDKSGVKIQQGDDDSEDDERNQPKYAETDFEKLFYDEKSNTSVVIAHPRTGRTHQIRIHLRYVGFPIANDPCYGGIIYNDLKEFDNPDLVKYQHFIPEDEGSKIENAQDNIKEGQFQDEKQSSNNKSDDNTNIKTTLSVSQIYCYKIWLHAWKYKFDEYIFETKHPLWVDKSYQIDKKF
jgi:23S rRNA-/tRNA-specific pseudouridylate synthase